MYSPYFQINQNINTYSQELKNAIQNIGVPKKLGKLEKLIDPETNNDFFFYITHGVFKTTRIEKDRTFILGFTFPGDVDGDPGYLLGKKSDFTIIPITKAEVKICTWFALENELGREKYLSIVNFYLSHYTVVLQNRIIESLAHTAEDRYKKMVDEQPKYLNEIPITDLASYLGITKQSLSRIRGSRF